MSDAVVLVVWFAAFVLLGSVIALPCVRLIAVRWPSTRVPFSVTLGLGVLFLSWTAALQVTGSVPTTCADIFEGTDNLDKEARSELLARCVATAGEDEMAPATVLRRYPSLYGFSLRPKGLSHQ
jgi:hypothetical protein